MSLNSNDSEIVGVFIHLTYFSWYKRKNDVETNAGLYHVYVNKTEFIQLCDIGPSDYISSSQKTQQKRKEEFEFVKSIIKKANSVSRSTYPSGTSQIHFML